MSFSFRLLGLIVIVVVYLGARLFRWEKRRQLIRQFGCRPMPKYPSAEPFGQDYDRAVKTSFQDGHANRTAMEMYNKVGSTTYEVRTMKEHVVHTCEPRNHQAIVTNMNDWYRDVRKGAMPFSGVNLLSLHGDAWKRVRDLIDPLFKRAELRDIEYFEKFVDRALELIPRDNRTIDMQSLLRKLFLDSSTEFVFGESIDSLRDTSDKPEKLLAAFRGASAGVGKRIRPTGIQLVLNNWTPPDKEWLADCKYVHDYIDGCIARYRSGSKSNPGDRRKRYVLIKGMSEAYPDPVALRFHLLGLFSIARETAAMAMSNVLFMLARNPHVWTELRKQALEVDEQPISFETLNKLSFFRYTVLETFRMQSPITRVRRVSVRDTVLPLGGGPDGSSPAFIPKGTTIWGDYFPKTRDTSIWGDDVETFRPSRFEGRRLGWEFRPFSGGPRICPANQQVVSQCMYLLFRLVREFKAIENRDPCFEYVEHALSCFESKNGCKVAFEVN